MAKWAEEGTPPITGTVECFTIYQLSCDKWYVRKRSSITTKRILKDRAFAGFRKSSLRMTDASPIASKVYKQLPIKQYPLFREMTGKALLLLKAGLSVADVEAKLVEEYLPTLALPFVAYLPRFYKVLPVPKVYRHARVKVRGLYGDG
jgi:hypothetical protein